MKQVVQNLKSGKITVDNLPAPAFRGGGILVKNRYSLISAGTEKTSVDLGRMSMLQKARSRPEDVRKILQEIKKNGFMPTYRKVMTRLDSLKPLGYSSAGTVLAVDPTISEFKVGDRVACAGAGYAVHADVVFVPKNLAVGFPENVDPEDAAYSTLGAIAMQGIRQAQPTLGEIVVVIGLGLVGLLAVQILKANGCRVIGVDTAQENVRLAKKIGADEACLRSSDVKSIVVSTTGGFGADAVVIAAATRSSDPVMLAGEIARDRSRIVMIGATGMNIPRPNYYMKELEFKLSRSYGPGRYDSSYEEQGRDYPIGYIRWTEKRNMGEFVHLLADKKVDVKTLTTHVFPIDMAEKAYKLVSGEKNEKYVGILLEYPKEPDESISVPLAVKTKNDGQIAPATDAFKKNPLHIGFIGAGNFAQAHLIPGVKGIPDAILESVCTATGTSAKTVQNQFGFRSITTDADEILLDQNIGTVFVATRHNLHASLLLQALKAGKNAFVEKPIALNEEELISIAQFYRANEETDLPLVMVGFNRRFAPLAVEMKKFFSDSKEPMIVNYRVNAGFIPSSHWTQDPAEGGGRIIGEVCHFVDFIQFMTGSQVERVFAESVGGRNENVIKNENVNISLRLSNGSMGIITYVANGDGALSKERIEVTTSGRAAVIDNFQRAYFYKSGKERISGNGKINKGIYDEVNSFVRSAGTDRHRLISFNELINSSLTTFRILTSLSVGEPINI